MKALSHIISREFITAAAGASNPAVSSVTADSRQVAKGGMFVAIKGLHTDGHQFIDQAISRGATVIVCEAFPESLNPHVAYVQVKQSNRILGVAASALYNHPSQDLRLIGVTGTNGKTTVVTLLHEVFTKLGYACGLISTVENRIETRLLESKYTTPDAVSLQKLLAEMVGQGCEYVFMEVSSHALEQYRTEGCQFAGGIFTNLSHDHLDYHGTFKSYLKAKKSFFDHLPPQAFALTNLDDKNGMVMLQNTRAKKATYSLRAMADYKAIILENGFQGLHLRLGHQDLWCRLTGQFNAYNILAVYATGILAGQQEMPLMQALSDAHPVEGRFDWTRGKEEITGIVDYAHTPDALDNVLRTISELRTGGEKLITLVGCGGNRDREKRPQMASIAARYSDQVIFTSDNPRDEDPEAIIADMMEGLRADPSLKKKAISITGRGDAIQVACIMAAPGDIILVAGKGHEKYQEINGVKHPFDDKAILLKHLNK